MGLIYNRIVEDDCILGIWEIEESYEELLSQLQLNGEDLETVERFGNYQRKLEWLSVRVLVNQILNKPCRIVYNETRKPFLDCNTFRISISHSHKLTSILLSRNYKVGIDLEYMSHQIHRVAHKFINEKEYITSDNALQRLHLYIHWCAKEALYKICDKQDINFKQNLTILPFNVEKEGIIVGHVDNRFGHDEYLLHYTTYDDYVIVWCKK
ncbi:MAG: 4'-phosphopantetheinyl transferase superfamily protein [Bacteroidales bacterium]|nr:4'-phosphopantetheinyl transferase superfamily protein [Bacteroidales bacterium]